MGDYSTTINQLKSILTCEFALMKTGIVKPNKTLLFSFARVIDHLKEKEKEEKECLEENCNEWVPCCSMKDLETGGCLEESE